MTDVGIRDGEYAPPMTGMSQIAQPLRAFCAPACACSRLLAILACALAWVCYAQIPIESWCEHKHDGLSVEETL